MKTERMTGLNAVHNWVEAYLYTTDKVNAQLQIKLDRAFSIYTEFINFLTISVQRENVQLSEKLKCF
jgi:hypothetical protein